MIIKSNSIILASDLSPAFQAVGDFVPYKRGLFPIAFVDNLAFDVQGNRIRSKQIGGQEFSVESLAFSPTVSLSFDYVSSLTFDNENLLGMFFKGWGDFQSVFKGSNGQSCNLYFILSDLFGLDLIQQIKDRGNLNGLEMISFGNCTLSNYNLAIAAASLPKTSIQMEAVNMEMQVVSSDFVNVPAINLAVGNKDGAAQLKLNNSEFITNLNALNTSATGQPILPTYQTTAFNIVTENPQVPSIKISPWADAAISSIGFSIGIEREASYGFGSDFIYDKKIKFPIVGNLNISATALALNSGVPILTGAMSNEPSYSLELQFIDPSELKYINQSIGTLSGYADQNYKGFLTNNKYLKIDNAKLESHSHSIDYASNLTVEFGFSFTCNEQNGLLMKWGQRSEKEGAQLFTYEGLKIQSSDGSGIDLDNYLYFKDISTPIIPSICASPGLSSDGLMLLTRDNTADFVSDCFPLFISTGVILNTGVVLGTGVLLNPGNTETQEGYQQLVNQSIFFYTARAMYSGSIGDVDNFGYPTLAWTGGPPHAQINWGSFYSFPSHGHIIGRSESGPNGPYTQIFSGVGNVYRDYDILNNDSYYWYNINPFFGNLIASASLPKMVYFPTI
jgi:hypothetical protein